MEMGRITLAQLLQYFDPKTEPEYRIQIVMPECEWDCADEVWVGSHLLDSIKNYYVYEIEIEESYQDEKPVLRVSVYEESGEEE
jgi:hypothetical protein